MSELLAGEVATASGDDADVPFRVNLQIRHRPIFRSQLTLGVGDFAQVLSELRSSFTEFISPPWIP